MAEPAKPCPYRVLGVRKNASAEAVRRAHRRLAMKFHPDRGGDPEKFRAVDWAYKLLSDPERKRRYDETGDCSEPAPDNAQAELLGVLSPLLAQILLRLADEGRDVRHEDLVRRLRDALAKPLADAGRKRDVLGKVRDALAEAAGRFGGAGGGEELLADVVRAHLRDATAAFAQAAAEAAKLAKAADFLRTVTYRTDGPAGAPTLRTAGGIWAVVSTWPTPGKPGKGGP